MTLHGRHTEDEQAMNPTVETVGIGHSYGGRVALADVTFSLSPGTTALVGVNGAGKSTLLRIIAGALKPGAGSIRLLDRDPYQPRERKTALRHVALMPQLAMFPPNMTVVEVVSFIGWMRGLKAHRASDRAMHVIEQVGLGNRAHEKVKALSGGMVRRVALAQALVSEPDVLLLDEPSTGLDPEQRRIMVRLIQGLETTVLFSSHVIEDVADVADRVLVLEDGRLVFDDHLSALEAVGAQGTSSSEGPSSGIEAGFLRVLSRNRENRT
jgi:ABC-2 type transport system ATP-binding protein